MEAAAQQWNTPVPVNTGRASIDSAYAMSDHYLAATMSTDILLEMARKLPRLVREKALQEKLGVIRNVTALSFHERVFTLRIITSKMVMTIETELRANNLAADLKDYDPWDTKWFNHCLRLKNCIVTKQEVDPGDLLHAEMSNMFRKMALQEPEGNNNVEKGSLLCEESMYMVGEHEEEEIEGNGAGMQFSMSLI